MMAAVLLINGALVLLMAAVETVNFRRTGTITFLTAAHALILIGYCLPAFTITFVPGTFLETGPWSEADPNPWGSRIYILDLFDFLALPASTYLTASIILMGSYIAMVAAYFTALRLPVPALDGQRLPKWGVAGVGLFLLAIAAAAFAIYTPQFASVIRFLHDGQLVRKGGLQVQYGFLQVLMQVGVPAFILLIAASLRFDRRIRAVFVALAFAAWALALARLLHAAGRLELGSFLAFPVLALMFLLRSKKTTWLMAGGLVLVVLVVASVPHDFFRHPLRELPSALGSVASDVVGTVHFIIAEFAFPFVTSAHALTLVPDQIPFRYFIDIPLGAAYMMPSFGGVDTLPPMILSLQARILPWMPVDLLAFGYYSLGTLGALMIFAGFGAVLAVFDRWLTVSPGWLGQALRAAWLFYLPFRLFYADPYAAAQWGFGLIAGTFFVLMLSLWSRWRSPAA